MSLRQKNHVTLKFDFIKLYSFNFLVLRLLSQNQYNDQRVLMQTETVITQSFYLPDEWMDGWMNGSWVLPADAIVETSGRERRSLNK